MAPRGSLVAIVLASCAPSAPLVVPGSSTDARIDAGEAQRDCVTPAGRAINGTYDLDDDGVADPVTERPGQLSFYVRRGACAELIANVPLEGPLAFVSVRRAPSGSDVDIDTWLVHGDRRRVHYRFRNGRLEPFGRSEEIAGPRPPSR